MKPLGLYIDIPFCIARCAFCAFPVEGYRRRWADRYMDALQKEIESYGADPEIQGRRIGTIYIGGGTPSHFPVSVIADLLALLRRRFRVDTEAEITLEAHPATVDADSLSRLREIGINRLSLGVQSFSDDDLTLLGRHHTVEAVYAAFRAARFAGFDNIGIDLMYALPGQTVLAWEKTLQQAVGLAPEHLSIYALSVEPGTLFAKQAREGSLTLPSEADAILFYKTARTRLALADYKQYEISNFSKPGYVCRHNCLYWDQNETLSFGLAAHSYFNHARWCNTEKIPTYIEKIASGRRPLVQIERPSQRDILLDQIIFGLRKTEGIPRCLLSNDPFLHQTTKGLVRNGLLKQCENRIQLTLQGMLMADDVAVAYL